MARVWSTVFALAFGFALTLGAGCITPQNTSTTTTSAPTVATSDAAPCAPVPPSSSSSVSAGDQASVSNNPGSFSYSGQLAAKTARNEYAWTDPSPTARISWSSQVAAGSMHVTILDACGASKYDNTNAAGQQGQYKALPNGRPGQWLVRLDFQAYTGQVSISLTS